MPKGAIERLRVREICSLDDWESLREPWTDLIMRVPTATPFQTWEWNYGMARFGSRSVPRVAVIEDDEGRWVALAPFCQRPAGLPGLRGLELIGGRVSDYLGVVVDSARQGDCETILRNWLTQLDGWKVLHLRCQTHLDTSWMPKMPSAVVSMDVCPFARLPTDLEDYERTMADSLRRQIFKNRRRLLRNGRLTFHVPATPGDLRRELPVFFRLHQLRQNSLGERGHFSDPGWCEVFTETALGLLELGIARLGIVRIDDRPAASQFNMRLHGVEYFYQTGMDPGLARFSPGSVLHHWLIGQGISESVREYDFGRGAEPYKFMWASERREVYHIVFSRSNALLQICRYAEKLRKRVLRSTTLKRIYRATVGRSKEAADT